jgi:hypothetical protein
MPKGTHCKKGHEYVEGSWFLDKRGSRHCKPCNLERMRVWREGKQVGYHNSNKTHCAKGHPYDAENTVYTQKKDGKMRRNCKACGRLNHARIRFAKYGIDKEQFDQIFIEQNNACAICNKDLTDKKPHIDHDHSTGKVRGVLCFACNSGLGQFQDSPETLQKAIDYLSQFSKTTV